MSSVVSQWSIPVAELLRHPGTKREITLAGPLGDIAVTASRVPPASEARVTGLVEALDGITVQFKGTVLTPWVGECRRCLGPASGDLVVEVHELFERAPESEDIYPLQADRLDLEPVARDAIYLELPQAPLCTADCQGLCPECGADRNTADCGHAVGGLDPRWDALRGLGDQN
ncbi:MAG: DUF177 domain-containing protein [Acidimicrobiales bacterium]|nr:DUF177 domain-containing protein [Acidimicrobiales bacterium]